MWGYQLEHLSFEGRKKHACSMITLDYESHTSLWQALNIRLYHVTLFPDIHVISLFMSAAVFRKNLKCGTSAHANQVDPIQPALA